MDEYNGEKYYVFPYTSIEHPITEYIKNNDIKQMIFYELERGRSGIYAIINKTNNRYYVGQSMDIGARWEQHILNIDKEGSELYQDLKRLGKNNFEFRVIEYCNPRYLDEREVFFINKLKGHSLGYNRNRGNINKVKAIENYILKYEN